MRIADSAKLFIRGPVRAVAGVVSLLSWVVGVVLFLRSGSAAQLWMFLFFGAVALVGAAFWTLHQSLVRAAQRENELPSAIERLLQKGMDQLDAMVAAQKADPQRLGPWGEQEREAWDFFDEARQLLIDHDKRSLLDDLGERTNEARRLEREKQKRPFERLTEREDAGEKVTDAEKMKVWGEDLRRSSIGEMEAILSGVSKVAKHVQS